MKDLATKNTKDTKKVWPTVRLGDVCEFRRGLTYSKGDEAELSSNVVLRSNNVSLETGKLDFTELKYLKETFVIPADKKVVQSSLLMCMANGSKPHLGKVALIDKDYGYAFGGFMGLLVPNDIDPKYLYLALTSAQFKSRIKSLQDGANINNLKFADIADFHFPLPPLTVQREIVARLEKELGEADKLAAKFKRVAELADNAFKAELDETFKALEDNSRRDAETRRVRLGDVCERITKGTTPTSVGYCFVESGINFVKIESFSEDGSVLINRVAHISPECHLALKRSQLQAEDVLFSIAGAIGRVAIVGEDLLPANTNQALAIIRTSKEKSLDVKFLKYSLCSCSVKEQYVPMQKTTAQSNLSLQNVSDFILSIPTLDAQRAIVAKLDAAKERCEKLKAAAMRGHAAAENLRKAILAEAFEQ